MISLKRYLDSAETQLHKPEKDSAQGVSFALLSAYRSALAEIGECSANACPDLVSELKRQLTRLDEDLGDHPGVPAITMTSEQLHELLKGWGNKTAGYYQQRAAEVKDLLLVMARTAESLGHNGDRYTHQLDSVTAQLETISKLEDVTRIRTSIEDSARQLKISIARMTAESKAVMDHLRVEVSTYRAKLEKAESLASCDALTGLGSRLWAEARIQQRIEIGNPFCVLMIDVHGFRRVNQEYGNMVGDLIMKEFARELRSSCRFSDLVARWAGDAFLVVLDCAAADAKAQISRLQSWICRPYQVPGRSGQVSVHLSTKIGIAESRQGDSMPEILDRADAALCAVREQARNQLIALG